VLYRNEREKAPLWINEGTFKDKVAMITGSIMESDQSRLFPACVKLLKEYENFRLVVVPHDPDGKVVEKILSFFEGNDLPAVKSSQLKESFDADQILIVDSVGILASLYKFCQVAYIGGSFGPGVHNVMEPSVASIPVLFGPHYRNSHEAVLLVECQGGFAVKTSDEIYSVLSKIISDRAFRERTGNNARRTIINNLGASRKTVDILTKFLRSR
ncbi:MAG: 3-deoxy-D-manno-octulosonic acid transferase, partial [Fidelibacterota bacterium]